MHQKRDNDFVQFNKKELTVTNLIEIEIVTDTLYADSKNSVDLSVVHLMDCQFLYYTLEIPQLDLVTTEAISGDSSTLVFNVPSGLEGTNLDITVTAYDEHNLYNSATKTVTVVQKPLIYPPTILTPIGVVVSNETSLTVTLDTYTPANMEEKHVATDYILYEQVSGISDAGGSESETVEGEEPTDTVAEEDGGETSRRVVADKIFDINNLTRCTLSNLRLDTEKKYTVAARFHSKHYKSDYSFTELTVLDNVTTTVSGRKLYRHPSGMGSVLEYTDNKPRKVVILDAAYRTIAQFGAYNVAGNAYYATANTSNSWYLNSSAFSAIPTISIPDSSLNTWWKNSLDARTSRQNCDYWMGYADTTDSQSIQGCPAIQHCRDISISGIGACDLPNIQLLQRIFIEANSIDSLDPTLEDNLAFALGSRNSSGNYWTFSDGVNSNRIAISSTSYSATGCRNVNYQGHCGSVGKNAFCGVIPVAEFVV